MNKFPSIGVARHRIATDGNGVTTLVAAHGCPLQCRYCLNPHCNSSKPWRIFTVRELYEKVAVDDLYFQATGGGITFGGGEPLLYAEFIAEFVEFARSEGKSWRYSLETSLAVPEHKTETVLPYIDEFIVDIKDADPNVYRAYTQRDISQTLVNLQRLSAVHERVTVRTPLIPEFNGEDEVLNTQSFLREMGFTRFDKFTYMTDIKKFPPSS